MIAPHFKCEKPDRGIGLPSKPTELHFRERHIAEGVQGGDFMGVLHRRSLFLPPRSDAHVEGHPVLHSADCGVGLSGAVCGSAHRASTLMVCLDVNAAHVKTHRESGGVVAAPELVTQQSCGAWGFHRRHKP